MTASKDILADRYLAKSSIHEMQSLKKYLWSALSEILFFLDLNCLRGFMAAREQ